MGVTALTLPAESKACKNRKDVVAEISLLAWESDLRAIGGMPATSQPAAVLRPGADQGGRGLRTPALRREPRRGAGPVEVLVGGRGPRIPWLQSSFIF